MNQETVVGLLEANKIPTEKDGDPSKILTYKSGKCWGK
jgi:hypothetical protein